MNTMTESGKQTYRIAGLVYHVETSERECGKFDGFIEPEPSNPHDPNAMVIKKSDGTTVGYIQRRMVEMFCLLNGRQRVPCEITIRGRKDGGELVYIEGYVTPATNATISLSEALSSGHNRNQNPAGAKPQQSRPTAPQRPSHARTGQQMASQTAQWRSGEPMHKDTRQNRRKAQPQPSRPRHTAPEPPRGSAADYSRQEISDKRNVSPLSSFERLLFLMIIAALLLVLAHILS